MTTELVLSESFPEPNQLTHDEQMLIKTIRIEFEQGEQDAYVAIENEKKKTYWTIGKQIKEHLLKNKDRANYGEYLMTLLPANVDISRRNLYRSLHFYEEYPQIVATSPLLSWSHYAALVLITEEKLRSALEQQAINEKLSVRDLTERVQKELGHAIKPAIKTILQVNRTTPYIYEFEQINGIDMVDLGFNMKIESRISNKKTPATTHFGAVPHYTYKAFVIEVVDGDTIWVNIDLGMKAWTTQKLRLRGVNSAEIAISEGKTAKDHIINVLAKCQFVAIKTYWRDKYTRYLSDVFYDPKENKLKKLVKNGKFLNQELLDKGLAQPYDD